MPRIRVTPDELGKAASQLTQISTDYQSISNQMLQQASTMGEAWEGADNLAFVDQINGFCEELKAMAKKLSDNAAALNKQKDNYLNRQNDNIAQVKKLTN